MENIVITIISAIATIVGVLITSKRQSNLSFQKMTDEINRLHMETVNEINLIKKDLSTLSERVEKHNHVIERVYEMETEMRVLESRVNSYHGH